MKDADPIFHLKVNTRTNPELKQKKAVIGKYVPADLFERESFYSSHRRANRELGNLVGRLAERSANSNVFVFESSVEKLSIYTNLNVFVATLEIGFTYDERRDARKTFKGIQDSGLMLRCNSSYLCPIPMIQKGEFDENLEYKVEDRGKDTLKWLVGGFRTVKTLGVYGFSGSKYKLEM